MIERLLVDGSQQPTGAGTFAQTIEVIAGETDKAIECLLAGEPVDKGGTTWPGYYEQFRKEDLAKHGGEPVSLRKLLEARAA
jgi:hypothetical protein